MSLVSSSWNRCWEELDVPGSGSLPGNTQQPPLVTEAGGGDTSTALTHWTRFQDALHQMLDDETSHALPVVDSMENDGKETRILHYAVV
ncbi:unnamed protein product [Brassica oleracea var. botrytis]|uniref:Uncharacterized protein n=2 Tax=Brassica TaxID=3705 RepID=A0A3P6DDX8_BRAOL|nr:unnamed protein product [Brassica napus]CDY37637.1 BnaCnng08520D [Brassica napus]VDD24448.1 unnamed protein product [Brassica oleracea]